MESIFEELGLKRWLVADDQDIVREIWTRILGSFGLEVKTVSDGKDALIAVATEKFDAVLIDGQMPGLSGYDTARAIRRSPSRQVSSIIIVLSTNDANHADLAQEAGMDASFSKPTSKGGLLKALKAIQAARRTPTN